MPSNNLSLEDLVQVHARVDEQEKLLRESLYVHENAAKITRGLPQPSLEIKESLSAKEAQCQGLKRKWEELGGEEIETGDGDDEQWNEAIQTKLKLGDAQLSFVSIWLEHIAKQMKETPESSRGSAKYQELVESRERLQILQICSSREQVAVRRMTLPVDSGATLYRERARMRTVQQVWTSCITKHFEQLDHRKQLPHLSRNETASKNFSSSIREVYTLKNELGQYWCPITHHWWDKENMKVAHLVPHLIGEEGAGLIFGEPGKGRGVIWNIRNGLWIQKRVEKAFDAAQITIIPCANDRGQGKQFEVFVLDDSILDDRLVQSTITFRQLHGRPFDFKDIEMRPGRRYLYFMFVVAMGLLERRKEPGWPGKLLAASGKTPRVWATCGRYFKRGALRELANLIGANGDDPELFLEFDEAEASKVNKRLSVDLTSDRHTNEIATQLVLKAVDEKENRKLREESSSDDEESGKEEES